MGKKRENNRRVCLALSRIVIGIFAISFFLFFLVTEINNFSRALEVETEVQVATIIANFVHYSGLERGKSTIYLSSTSSSPQAVIIQQQETNQILPTLYNSLQQLTYAQIPQVISLLGNLSTIQEEVTNRTISSIDMFNWYSNLNNFLFEILAQSVFFEDVDLTKQLQELMYLNWYLEWMGQERASVAKILNIGYMADPIGFCMEYWSIRQTQSIFYQQVITCADDEELQVLQSIEMGETYNTTLNIVNNFRKLVISVSNGANATLDQPNQWFNNMTVIINSIFTLNPYILNNIQISLDSFKSDSETRLILALFGAVFELLASLQLIYVAFPVFLLFFSWNKSATQSNPGIIMTSTGQRSQ